MTNKEKSELRGFVKTGWGFKDIRSCMDCSSATIRNYMKIFKPKKEIK